MSYYPGKELALWDVKPIWIVSPSPRWGSDDFTPFVVWGISRVSTINTRPTKRLHSLEEYNQEHIDLQSEFYCTIFEKETGHAFEMLRRIASTKTKFKIQCAVITDLHDWQKIVNNLGKIEYDQLTYLGKKSNEYLSSIMMGLIKKGEPLSRKVIVNRWMKGYETYDGCRVIEENTNYNIAEFPVREFRCSALRHGIKEGEYPKEIFGTEILYTEVVEGGGQPTTTRSL